MSDTPEEMRDLASYCGTQACAALKRYAELLERGTGISMADLLEQRDAEIEALKEKFDVAVEAGTEVEHELILMTRERDALKARVELVEKERDVLLNELTKKKFIGYVNDQLGAQR